MSVAASLGVFPEAKPTTRRGRPRVSLKEDERKKHIQVAFMLACRVPAERIAAAFEIGETTVYRWRDLALGYDDIEAEGLRRFVGRN